jgi:uncharacterized integral membrane protein
MASDPSSESGPAQTPTGGTPARRSRRDTARLVAVGTLAVLATLFAVLNLDEVEVNLLFGSPKLPLIVVIVGCLLIGAVFGAVLETRRGRRRGG